MENSIYKITFYLTNGYCPTEYETKYITYCDTETSLQVVINGVINNKGYIASIISVPQSERKD